MQSSFYFMTCFLLVQVIQNVSPWLTWADANRNEPAQKTSSLDPNPITTHVLDTARGLPAASVGVSLYRMAKTGSAISWIPVKSKLTNEDGRASEFLTGEELDVGTYKMVFNTGDYFAMQKTTAFHPFIEVDFEIQDPTEHYHIALTVSAFSYSTYRGS